MVNIVIKGLYFSNEITELKTEYLLVFTLQSATVIQVDKQFTAYGSKYVKTISVEQLIFCSVF